MARTVDDRQPDRACLCHLFLRDGRNPALALAAGVITGSLFWAILAATGISAVQAAYTDALFVIKILGGVYLLYLALRAGQSAMRETSDRTTTQANAPPPRYRQLYRQGILMHIGNPKAVLAWIAIMSLELRNDTPSGVLPTIIGCGAGSGDAVRRSSDARHLSCLAEERRRAEKRSRHHP